tara:strand:- start:70 stop:330 length:261 start_codon:yes stop_codon:yes gene_type:complete
MNSEDKDTDLNEEINDKFVMLLVAENGNFSWVVSPEISEDQEVILERVHTVMNHPSIILLLVIFIELSLIRFSDYIKNLFTLEDNE